MSLTVKVSGLREVNDFLTRELPAKVAATAIAQALRMAAKPIRDAARSNAVALGGSGALALAISAWRTKKNVKVGTDTAASVEVGPRRGNKAALARYYAFYGKKPTPKMLQGGIRHGHLVEWGTKRTAPRRFMQRAFDAQAQNGVAIFEREIGAVVEKAALNYAAKNGSRQ